MNLKKSILIHHHAVAYVSKEGIWVQNFIASWVDAISPYFDKIGLLVHESSVRLSKQDTLISSENVILESLGEEGRTWDRIQRIKRIKTKCRQVSPYYCSLVIRGITPRGYTVFKFTQIRNKYFLLVGSIKDSKPQFNIKELYSYLMYFVRFWELKKMGPKIIGLSNSKKAMEEFSEFIGKKVYFTPTATIKEKDITPFFEKEIDINELKILFCGRITSDKGVYELFNAFKILKSNLGINMRLFMVGAVDDFTKKKLSDIAVKGGFERDVNWTGFIPYGEDLFNLYRMADFCILPSYHEGFPKVIWEAAIFSLPMIVTPVGGISALVSEKDVSFIYPKSVNSIVEVLHNLILNPSIKLEKSKSLYQLALQFTEEKNAYIFQETLTKAKL